MLSPELEVKANDRREAIEHESKVWAWNGFVLHHFFSKIQAFIHFAESNYEKMVYLDSDIYVNRDDENIFDEIDEGIAYAPAHLKRVRSLYKRWYFMNFREWPEYPLVQGGLMLISGRENAHNLCKLIELEIFALIRDPLREKKFSKIGIDQPVFSQVFLKSGEKIKILDQKWNAFHENAQKTDNFIHYSGAGKTHLVQSLG